MTNLDILRAAEQDAREALRGHMTGGLRQKRLDAYASAVEARVLAAAVLRLVMEPIQVTHRMTVTKVGSVELETPVTLEPGEYVYAEGVFTSFPP